MDFPQHPTGSSSPPRKENQIQGPRPAPLKVRKDSYKIKKPPLVPQPQPQQLPQRQPLPPRRPVIIYAVSPKVIHTSASDFMTLVQRLTGPNSSSSSTSVPSSSSSYVDNTASHVLASPAARLATIEKANNRPCFQALKSRKVNGVDHHHIVEGFDDEEEDTNRGSAGATLELERTTCSFPGILSPAPSSFPPISPGFFSPTPEPNNNYSLSSLAFLQDLSPAFHGNRNYIDAGTVVPSPITFFSSAPLTSPTPFMDLFNHFDL